MSNSESSGKSPEVAVASSAPNGSLKAKKPNIVWRFFKWMWRIVDGKIFPGPVGRTVVAVVMLIIGIAGSEAYQFVRNRISDPDEEVKKLATAQKDAFGKLDRQIVALHGAVDESGKRTLAAMEGTLDELKKANAALVSRLKEAGGRGASAAELPAGIYMGDMVVVRELGSIVVDPSTSIGIQSIFKEAVVVRVSSLVDDSGSERLDVGESVSYRRGDGRVCKTTLISLSEDQGATMRTACASQ